MAVSISFTAAQAAQKLRVGHASFLDKFTAAQAAQKFPSPSPGAKIPFTAAQAAQKYTFISNIIS